MNLIKLIGISWEELSMQQVSSALSKFAFDFFSLTKKFPKGEKQKSRKTFTYIDTTENIAPFLI
jgi:hypothetical protein